MVWVSHTCSRFKRCHAGLLPGVLLDLQRPQPLKRAVVENAFEKAAGLGTEEAWASKVAADDAAIESFGGGVFKRKTTDEQRVQNDPARHSNKPMMDDARKDSSDTLDNPGSFLSEQFNW